MRSMQRHGRQSRLAEIGAEGQGRIAAATAEVRSVGLAGEVATRYLAGAGFGALRVRDASLAPVAAAVDPAVKVEVVEAPPELASPSPDPFFRDPAAAALARGAREALREIQRALSTPSKSVPS
jgi:hypothetical protein